MFRINLVEPRKPTHTPKHCGKRSSEGSRKSFGSRTVIWLRSKKSSKHHETLNDCSNETSRKKRSEAASESRKPLPHDTNWSDCRKNLQQRWRRSSLWSRKETRLGRLRRTRRLLGSLRRVGYRCLNPKQTMSLLHRARSLHRCRKLRSSLRLRARRRLRTFARS